MNYNLLFYLISPLVAFLTHKLVIWTAHKYSILDIPDGTLKPHSLPIPKLGGIGLFVGILSALVIFPLPEWEHSLFAIPVMFLLGLSDDIKPLSPRFRLIIQILTGGFLGWQYQSSLVIVILFAISFTFFINAINMFDGINALLSTHTLLVWVGLLYLQGNNSLILFSILTLLPFYAFNRPNKASLFMGDAGSYTIACLSFIFVFFPQANTETPSYSIVIAGASLFLIPIFDAAQVICRRLYEKRSPFSGDRYHSYDILITKNIKIKTLFFGLFVLQTSIFILTLSISI